MRRVLGLDVGGTKVASVVLREGVVERAHVEKTAGSSSAELLAQLAARVLDAQRDAPLAAVGVGVPGVLDPATGTIGVAVNVPLAGIPLRTLLSDRTGVPVVVDNDASLAALAEAHADDGSLLHRSLAMLTLGTGVGGGIVIDGRPYRGLTGTATELGHMIIDLAGEADEGAAPARHELPHPGSLEALASGRTLDALARARGLRDGTHAVEAARAGDDDARTLIATIGHRVGVAAANLINVLEPEVVAIGGGVSVAGELLLAPVRQTARRLLVPGVGTRTEVRIARGGPGAGARGAALLALGALPSRCA